MLKSMGRVMTEDVSLGLLLVRVGLGLVFMAHGADKISNMEGTVAFFTGTVGVSAFWAYVVAYVELLGGLAMLTGIFTGWAGILLAVTMFFSIYLVKLSKGFLSGYEFDLMLFLSALAISIAGSGKYTLKRLFGKE